jgi:hypothetical protein
MSDDDLRQRLDKLKSGETHNKQSVDQRELEIRIAKLKGIDPARYTAPPITVYVPFDKRNDIEKANDLLEQLVKESALDEALGVENERRPSVTDDEIERRLRKLKGPSVTMDVKELMKQADNEELMDSDEECEIIAKRLLAESRLPDVVPSPAIESVKTEKTEEELPWCVICNEDAVVCCKDCDDDIYCLECFKEFHADSDTRKHKTQALSN